MSYSNSNDQSSRSIAFIVPTLGEVAAQNEDVMQLLLYAAARVEQHLHTQPDPSIDLTILAVDTDMRGWPRASAIFSPEALRRVSVTPLTEAATPSLAIACHKDAYNVFEWLKAREFGEVHHLDRHGVTFYPSQAKHLGLHCLNTTFVIHVVGGTVFRKECNDELLDSVDVLAEDMLERGAMQRADAVIVHDRKAWRWYERNVDELTPSKVYDLAWPDKRAREPVSGPGSASPIIFYGTLGVDGGLPTFCDAIDRVLPSLQPPEVLFVGSSQGVGGMDAVSYIRLRSSKWPVPIGIHRNLSISDELSLLHERRGVVVCNTVKREGLRPRLVSGSDLCLLFIDRGSDIDSSPSDRTCAPIPTEISKSLTALLSTSRSGSVFSFEGLRGMWSTPRPLANDSIPSVPSPPLTKPALAAPKVSVCVTHYSRPDKLRTAIASLARQTYENFEVIVVDDGSPDASTQAELQKIDKELAERGWRLVVQDNRYLGAARNFAATFATGEYLLFMDDDNAAKPHELSTLVAVAQRTQADIVTAFCDVFETEQELDSPQPPCMRFTPYGSDPALGILTNCYGDANALYTRTIFDRLGGFTEDYGITHEDWEFFCLAALEGAKLVCVPEPLFWYRVDRNAMYRGERTQIHKASNLRRHIRPYLNKLPPYQARLVQLAQGLGAELPVEIVGKASRSAAPLLLREPSVRLPYARVAVIMRTKDRPLLLRRAIRSVMEQTFKDWVLVIVNDGGAPDAVQLAMGDMADELTGKVLVLHHPVSLGMQSASNAGISNCDSDFLIIHDDDDAWDKSFLARSVSYLDERGWDAKLGGVVTWSWVIVEELMEGGEIRETKRFIFNDKLHRISLAEMAVENRFPPISFLVRRAALEAVRPFKQEHGVLGDWEFHLRVLWKFDIGVIPEPLAHYHHRVSTKPGSYGNSVHVEEAVHRSTRIDLVNAAVRHDLGQSTGLSVGHLLFLGQLYKTAISEQQGEFKLLHDYLRNIENQVKSINSAINRPRRSVSNRRNLAINGDFRQWEGPGDVFEEAGKAYAFRRICSGFVLNFNRLHKPYRIERLTWSKDGHSLPIGKTYLNIENDGCAFEECWFMLEWIIPSVLAVAGRSICISAMSRYSGGNTVLTVGGRYYLGDGREVSWPNHYLSLSEEFQRWSIPLNCPTVLPSELSRGHEARILLKFPHDVPFEFALTDCQVEEGDVPTAFQYNDGKESLRYRLLRLWERLGPSRILPRR